jgi:SAM-dependent methyltransferase
MSTAYPLATDSRELERLAYQHEVWGGVTRAFLDRLAIRPGMRVLDLGSGPGFVTLELAERVGAQGRVTALDESERWTEHVRRAAHARSATNIDVVCARVQAAQLEDESFDLVFSRWVFSFLSQPELLVPKLARLLKPRGVLALQDYHHEGIAVYPPSAGFRAVIRATRAMYQGAGGDAFVAGRFPELFHAGGLRTLELHASVLCGGPESPAFGWGDAFFPHYSTVMVERGFLEAHERDQFLSEWEARKLDPTALFFSPTVVDGAAQKPG